MIEERGKERERERERGKKRQRENRVCFEILTRKGSILDGFSNLEDPYQFSCSSLYKTKKVSKKEEKRI